MKHVLLFLLIGTAFWSCDRCRGIDCTSPPPRVEFKLIINGQNVSANYPQARVFNANFTSGAGSVLRSRSLTNGSICLSTEVPFATSNSTLYLKLTDTDTDTLTFETRTKRENCCTFTQTISLRFNGQETVNQVDADYCHLFVKK